MKRSFVCHMSWPFLQFVIYFILDKLSIIVFYCFQIIWNMIYYVKTNNLLIHCCTVNLYGAGLLILKHLIMCWIIWPFTLQKPNNQTNLLIFLMMESSIRSYQKNPSWYTNPLEYKKPIKKYLSFIFPLVSYWF